MRSKSFNLVRCYFRLPDFPGGMEAHIERLSEAQREIGINVVNLFNSGSSRGSSVQILPTKNLTSLKPNALRNFIFYVGALLRRKELVFDGPTVLHIHGDWSDFIFSKVLAKAIGARLVVATIHSRIDRRIICGYKIFLSHCKLIFTTGKAEQEFLETTLGRNVYLLPSAPLSCFFRDSSDNVEVIYDVVTIANLYPVKRLEIVISCAQLRPSLKFVIVGSGPERDGLIALAKSLDLKNVVFIEQQSPEKIALLLACSRIFLMTSEYEGTPTACLEAMAVGLPVILTPSNNFNWLINSGVNGFITKSWEVGEILSYVDILITYNRRRKEMGDLNRALASMHSWPAKAIYVTDLMDKELLVGEAT
jgi:glycosyltransferase involved in cell wall biosynthesis